jgi:hypothetical protein
LKKNRRNYLIGGFLILALFSVGLIYILSKASARENLYHLAEIPNNPPLNLTIVRKSLLQLIPTGTEESDIYIFLVQHGAANINEASVNAITYSQKDNANIIDCYVSSDPGKMGYVGDEFHIRFILDNHNTLTDITIENTSRSL